MSVEQPNQEPNKEKRHSTRGQRGAFLASWLARRAGNGIKDDQSEQFEDHEKGGFKHRFKYLWSKLFTSIGVTEQIGEAKPEIIISSKKPDDVAANPPKQKQTPNENDEIAQVSSEYKGELIVDHSEDEAEIKEPATMQISMPKPVLEVEPIKEVKPIMNEEDKTRPGAPIVPLTIAEMSQIANASNIQEYNSFTNQPTEPLAISRILEQRQKLDLASLPPYLKLGYPYEPSNQISPPASKNREYITPAQLNKEPAPTAAEAANTEPNLPEPSMAKLRKEGFIEPINGGNGALNTQAAKTSEWTPVDGLITSPETATPNGATPVSAILASRPVVNTNQILANQSQPNNPEASSAAQTKIKQQEAIIKEPMPFVIPPMTGASKENTTEPIEKIQIIKPRRPEPTPIWQLPADKAEDDRYKRAILNGFWSGIVVVFVMAAIYLFH